MTDEDKTPPAPGAEDQAGDKGAQTPPNTPPADDDDAKGAKGKPDEEAKATRLAAELTASKQREAALQKKHRPRKRLRRLQRQPRILSKRSPTRKPNLRHKSRISKRSAMQPKTKSKRSKK